MIEVSSLEQLLSFIQREAILVVKFYADWCGPCKQIEGQYNVLSQVFTAVTFCTCNIDRNRACAERFQVQSIPTFIIWYRGRVETTIRGGDLPQVERVIVDLTRQQQHGEVAIASASREQSASRPIHEILLAKMNQLAQTIKTTPANKGAEQGACEAVYALLEAGCEQQPFGALLLPYFACEGFSAVAVDALFAYISSKGEPYSKGIQIIVNRMMTQLIEFFLASTLDQTRELCMMQRAVYSMVTCRSVLPIFVHSHLFYSDSFTDGLQLEYGTILGAILGVGVFSRASRPLPPLLRMVEWRGYMDMFPTESEDHSQKISDLQSSMETACDANKRIVLVLLQNKLSRFHTLRFMGSALRLNAGYTRTMHHDLPLSSRFFMCQLNDVLMEAALPVFTKGCDASSIPPAYLLEDPGEETVVDFGESVERITHYDENRPLPSFPSLQEPFKPTVHLFFLAARSMMLSVSVLIELHERVEHESSRPNTSTQQRALCIVEKSLVEGLIGSHSLGQKRVRLLNGIAGWLVKVMGTLEDGTLLPEPPETWKYLPQQLVEVVIRGMQLAPLDYPDVENVISLMLVLMGNTVYFPKPHTHALFPDFLLRLLRNEDTQQALMAHRWFSQNIVRSCVLCYIAVEKSTYEKVSVRYTLSRCTKSFLLHESLCQPVRAEFEAGGTLLERFSHMVTAEVNDAVDQLIGTLTQMNRLVREGADLSENPNPHRGDGGGNDGTAGRAATVNRGTHRNTENEEESEDETEGSPQSYHQLGLGLKQRILLFEGSVDLFIQLASSFPKGVAQNMVAQQISQMLARSLTSFVGADSKKLKIEHPERYGFRPREILGRIVECLVQFVRLENFLRCLCNCGVPQKDILQAMKVISERGLVGEHLVWKLNEIASSLQAMSARVREEEALWDEAPEFALDALLSTPLLRPIALPSDVKDLDDLVYTNEDTLHHLLLSESKHPFTKEYLDEEMVKEFNAREDVMQARERLQNRIAEWLRNAKAHRE
ncbi:ubiquitin fusion degradation protein 2, putative [Trypanosoma brucei brucei TREU927]|uniref:Ubiquitin fusion degradation protein 2, putative n=1 Tax=Trypanosoma brucei brucei (strain 927/4 GUTat10.1) TaxID=185431 RepID=Q584R0_TRYB2|nr:ubiquitin fusion degradation protein 2, putative [Trypanosoma brucei brucei TREU927]AAX80878.1 ubiquitin fusion degradation protein 2, putative [Trypanosoma brucei]AAZ11808.1 ubiquitin fusion degradation protein 2, putative [Trypanosoma brucei brucei TREU927]